MSTVLSKHDKHLCRGIFFLLRSVKITETLSLPEQLLAVYDED